jgi:hypothetical protein
MARQFREQLEEEVQLEQARRAEKQAPPVEPSTYHGPTPPAPPPPAPPPPTPPLTPAAAASAPETGPTPRADERGT